MATYTELNTLTANQTLRDKVRIAILVGAQAELAAVPGTPEGRKWATVVLTSPERSAEQALFIVLVANKDLSSAQITGASDVALQAALDAVRPALIAAAGGT